PLGPGLTASIATSAVPNFTLGGKMMMSLFGSVLSSRTVNRMLSGVFTIVPLVILMSDVVWFVKRSMPLAFVSSVREPVAGVVTFAVMLAGPSVIALMSALFGPARRSYSSGPRACDTGATTIVAVGATTAAMTSATRAS